MTKGGGSPAVPKIAASPDCLSYLLRSSRRPSLSFRQPFLYLLTGGIKEEILHSLSISSTV
eukprot:CAMPEP_0117665226 /NCGR_PEP_ID=MMETSP0804-20121206/9691_1 /TAXON_ID=1074897 /ORGANISM="Tetraselmis astigmatica, Strain CCMP880" /LENGTH=60 /DNA_ID=CAMNT_0005472613 /DNA_START=72 /DNA_END=254 /DNA_ORIENTATION=+